MVPFWAEVAAFAVAARRPHTCGAQPPCAVAGLAPHSRRSLHFPPDKRARARRGTRDVMRTMVSP